MNKKFASICIVTIILINLLIVLAFAGSTPLVSIGSTTGNVGTTVEIPVVLSDNSGFSSLGIEIDYDKAALTLTNVTQGTGIGANFTKAPALTVNPYNMSWDSASNTTFNGTLAMLTFQIISAKNGDFPITVDYYKGRNGTYIDGNNVNYDEDFNSLNLGYVSGKITVTGNAEIPEKKPTVTVGNVTCNTGETVDVPVLLSDNMGFSSLGIEVGYDGEALTLMNVVQGTGIGATFTNAPTLTTNPYNMSWDSASNTEFNGILAILTFKVLKTGTYPITVDYYKGRDGTYTDGKNVNYDENFNYLNLSYASGTLTARKTSSGGGMIVSGISFSIQLSGDDTTVGKVYAALYSSEGKLKVLKQYPASEIVNVSFAPGETGAYVKLMWWNENLQPMCEAQTIPL